MATQITHDRSVADARGDRDPRPTHAVAGRTTEQARVAADPNAQRAREAIAQLVRQGQNASLRSLQEWAELARKLGPTARSAPPEASMVCLAHDPFKERQSFDHATTLGDNSASR